MAHSSNMDSTGESGGLTLDSADYLFENTKYHDRQITVGDPSLDNVEKIGVVTAHLVSQSTVFRAMFENSMLADQTGHNTCITDISPEVFKLMLRFMYGGKMPQTSRDTLADLLLCADKYNIQPLVKWSSVRLVPTSVEDFFPALICVVYVNLPDLQPQVTKLLQERTVEVIENEQFFLLDEKCLEFIAMQETLAITELQLWESLVGWAKKKTEDPSEQRLLLTKPLKHVRFHTFTQDQIVTEVMNTNILGPAEIVHTLSAVTNNQPITMPGLCSIKEKRGFLSEVVNPKFQHSNTLKCYIKKVISTQDYSVYSQTLGYQQKSNFTIECKKHIQLQWFTIETRSTREEKDMTYSLDCSIVIVSYFKSSSVQNKVDIKSTAQVVTGMGDFKLNVKLNNGEPLILDPDTCYNFTLFFNKPHPVFANYMTIYCQNKRQDITDGDIGKDPILIKCKTPYHVKEIQYKV